MKRCNDPRQVYLLQGRSGYLRRCCPRSHPYMNSVPVLAVLHCEVSLLSVTTHHVAGAPVCEYVCVGKGELNTGCMEGMIISHR